MGFVAGFAACSDNGGTPAGTEPQSARGVDGGGSGNANGGNGGNGGGAEQDATTPDPTTDPGPSPTGDAGTTPTGDAGGTPDGSVRDAGPIDVAPCNGFVARPSAAPPASGRKITGSDGTPAGITSEGYVLYRDGSKLMASPLDGASEPIVAAEQSGTLAVHGPIAFVWTDMDWSSGRALLSIWTGGNCVRSIGDTLLAEDRVSANADGSRILYATNVTSATYDLVVATRDFSRREVLVPGIGRSNERTCGAQYGFSGDRIVVSSCAVGSQNATLAVYSPGANGYERVEVATDAQPRWTSDGSGERVFYVTVAGRGFLWNGTSKTELDTGVGSGRIVDGGAAVLYTVGDQLRRYSVQDALTLPIVTTRFRSVNAWGPNNTHVVFSDVVTYEGGERRDLWLARTDVLNPRPTALVATAAARVSRSVFSAAGDYVAYLTDIRADGGGTLQFAPIAGGSPRTFANADTAVAARRNVFVFSDDRTDPQRFPQLADLKVVDLDGASGARLLEAGIVDGRSFHVTADGAFVVYARPTGEDPDARGIYVRPLP